MKYTKSLYTLLLSVLLFPLSVFAQPAGGGGAAIPVDNPSFVHSDFTTVVTAILSKLIEFGTLLLAVMIVWTGFLFVSAGGSDERLKKAKTSLIATLIGGAIILGALGLSELIQSTFSGL